MFRQRGAIFREFLQQRCASQPADKYFVLSYKYTTPSDKTHLDDVALDNME
jgi:hypothetical protein